MTPQNETALEMTFKAAPPAAVAAANTTLTLPDIVNYATLLYLVLMIAHKAWRMYAEWRDGKAARDDGE